MSRGQIYAGKAAILLTVQDAVDQGLRGVRNKLFRFSNSLGMLGGALTTGGILGSIASGRMLKGFADFSDELLNLQVKLGYFGKLNKQQTADMSLLETTIRHLGRTTSFTAKEVAEAATELAQAGFSVKEINDSLQSTLDLARGAGYGLSESAAMMANAVRTFNIPTQKAGEVISQFVRATRLGTIGIEDLREALKYASGTAFNLEQTLPTVLGFMVQLSESGLKGSLAGTSLNVAMLNMIKNLEKMKGLVPGFELQFDARGAFDFTRSLQELFRLTKNFSTIQRTQVFGDIFNIRGARAVSSVQEIERVMSFINQIAGAGNEGRLAAITRDSGLGGSIRRATSALDDLAKTAGRIAAPAFKGLLESVAPLAAVIDRLAISMPNLTLAIVAAPFAIAAVGTSMLGMAFGIRMAATAVGGLMSVWKPLASMFVGGTARQMGALGLGRYGGILGPAGRRAGSQLGRGNRRLSGMNAFRRSGTAAMYAAAGQFGAGIGEVGSNVSRASRHRSVAHQAMLARGVATRQAAVHRRTMQNQFMVLRMMRARGVASPADLAAQSLRATRTQAQMVGQQGLARRMGAVSSRSNRNALSALFGAGTRRGFSGIGRGLYGMGRGFLAVANGIRRFVFSTTGLFTALEVLLLFGHKIPIVAAGFSRLGKGFSLAFKEIAAIAPLASSSLKLFFNSLGLLSEGNGKGATTGFNGMVFAVQNLISIIGNQLSAAWNRVVFAIAPVYDFFRKIAVTLFNIVEMVIEMSSGVLGARLADVAKLLTVDSSGGEWNTFFKGLAVGVATLFKTLIDGFDSLGNFFDHLLYRVAQGVLELKRTLVGNTLSDYHNKSSEMASIINQKDLDHALRIIGRGNLLKSIEAAIVAAFDKDTAANAMKNINSAHSGSINASNAATAANEFINRIRQSLVTGQLATPGTIPGMAAAGVNKQAAQMNTARAFMSDIIDSLVGSAHTTRGQLMLKGMSQAEYEKEQLKKLESIDEGIQELVDKESGATF